MARHRLAHAHELHATEVRLTVAFAFREGSEQLSQTISHDVQQYTKLCPAAESGKGSAVSGIDESTRRADIAIMIERQLGKQGLRVSALGLGCMGMSEFYTAGGQSDAESIRVIHHYLDAGGDFLDTADMYGTGRNEELVGKAIAGRRKNVVVATKFANVRGPNGEFLGVRGDRAYVFQQCDASLKRLKIDVIDLYYQHRVDPKVPIEETVGAMTELVKAGKARYLGLSEAAPAEEILPTLRELGIGFVAYSPLGRGFLTGRFKTVDDFPADDFRRVSPRFQGENFAKNLALLKTIEEMAKAKGCTPSQLALAWVLEQGDDIVPIPGTKHIQYLDENLGALNVRLTAEELQRINDVLPVGAASGERYPAQSMRAVNL
jgi:aryl-alcohol dehydrogenase-like predicted oxidoreductase